MTIPEGAIGSRPTTLVQAGARVIRLLGALVVGPVGGFLLLSVLFSDVMLDSPRWAYWLYVSLHLVIPGFLIGVLVPRHWALAALSSWGSVAMGAMVFSATYRGIGLPWIEVLDSFAISWVLLPGLALLSGWLGARLHRATAAGLRWR